MQELVLLFVRTFFLLCSKFLSKYSTVFFENQLFPKVFQWATGLTLKAVIPPLS
jgi:hypothetical protein